MNSLLVFIDKMSEFTGKFFSFFILIVMLITVYESLMRYGLNAPTSWVTEVSMALISPYFLFGGAYVLLKEGHVNMDLFYNRLSLRSKAILDIFTSIFFYSFIGVLLWKGLEWGWGSMMVGDNSGPPLYFPVYPTKLLLAIAAFLFLLQGFAKLIRDFYTAMTGEKYGS